MTIFASFNGDEIFNISLNPSILKGDVIYFTDIDHNTAIPILKDKWKPYEGMVTTYYGVYDPLTNKCINYNDYKKEYIRREKEQSREEAIKWSKDFKCVYLKEYYSLGIRVKFELEHR